MADSSDPGAISQLETHADAETSPGSPPRRPAPPSTLGESIGRYVVLEQIGRGGMGRVLRAYDPKLGREVALKLLRSDVLEQAAQARLVREAQAMAKLSHPNVVAVYDVEYAPVGVVVVMEHIRGHTLRGWLREEYRPWARIIERFVEAGHGLVAAHAEGLLHRDFKASNVLIPESGPAKVTDFGIAKAVTETRADDSASLPDDALPAVEALTQDGYVMGTPLYMAPEQHRGDAIGPAVDQYGFCVSLWEALTGTAPFHGTWVELEEQKHRGPPPWPETVELPRPLIDALCRGLAPEPELRWPSMETLLEVLDHRAPTRRRAWWAAIGAVGLLGAGGLGVALGTGNTAEFPERCTGASDQLRGIWDDAQRTRIESAILGTDAAYAPQAWTWVNAQLGDYAQAWTAMYTDTCEATTIRGEQSVQVMDLRMACLHRAKQGLRAVTEVLATADAEVVQQAYEVAGDLAALERCADVETLQAEIAPPSPEDAPAVGQIREAIARARAQRRAGRYQSAHQSLATADEPLATVSYPRVGAELALERGHVLEELGDYAGAEAAFSSAQRIGIELRQWSVLQHAASSLLFLVGAKLEDPVQALRYRPLAEGLAEGAIERARVHNALGNIWYAQGKYAEAQGEHQRALELQRTELADDHPDIASTRNNLSNALSAAGKYDEAEAEQRRALAVRLTSLGPEHPFVAMSRSNLANILENQGKYDEAETESRIALEHLESSLGPEHPNVVSFRNNYANVLTLQGRHAESEVEHRRVLDIRQRVLGPEHPSVAGSTSNLANTLYSQGKVDEAETEYRRALELSARVFEPKHPYIAILHNNLGNLLAGQRRYDEAEDHLMQALSVQEQTLGPEHPDVAMTHENLGNVLAIQGELVEAAQQLRRSLTIRQAALAPDNPLIADSHESLGVCLYEQGRLELAEAQLRTAMELHRAALGSDHPRATSSAIALARTLATQDRHDEARPIAEQVWARLEGDDDLLEDQAEAAFVLAEVLGPDRRQRSRARALARQAKAIYERIGVPGVEASREVDAWLRTHR